MHKLYCFPPIQVLDSPHRYVPQLKFQITQEKMFWSENKQCVVFDVSVTPLTNRLVVLCPTVLWHLDHSSDWKMEGVVCSPDNDKITVKWGSTSTPTILLTKEHMDTLPSCFPFIKNTCPFFGRRYIGFLQSTQAKQFFIKQGHLCTCGAAQILYSSSSMAK